MTELVSTCVPVRFVPDDQAGKPEAEQTAYLLKPAGAYDEALYRRACAERGGRFYTDEEMLACLRRGLEEMKRADLLPDVAAYEAVMDDPDGVPPDVNGRLEDVEEVALAGFEPYRRRHAARRYFVDVAPIEAFRVFCVGWENAGVDFARNQTGVPAELLDSLPRRHVWAAGDKAIQLMMLGGDAEKNSGSPSPGASTETPSPTAADGPPTAPPPRAKAGGSRKSAGKS